MKYLHQSMELVLKKKRNNVQLGNHAASMGLSFNFDEMKPTNTFDAHRLAKFAKNQGKEKRLQKIYFCIFH